MQVMQLEVHYAPYPTGQINEFESCNTAPRADVDSRTLREKSSFWQDVQAAFVQRRVNPSLVKPHSSKKLYDMSKEIIRLYFSADERITASGQNENDFPNSVNKNGAVPYLRNG
ncbi:uncharacterized protein PITG_21103 [Phytophthora infestans T30-4]|uniref:Uncharacterized protein n=1 Tax=Phytophthora infestans (strain T30-4) TaxID=403677 RepID=D0P3M2_PHYIT|nr:uncharacterized protein PITG_21103 [Phytophthora infestans T30-4]EEY60267.1 conserved hypothetical protein [Phytophthora infestans T30-4]|eukprot:XP_002895101.1 conserved hypothetical protein [Phytophthora infestans T30-4]